MNGCLRWTPEHDYEEQTKASSILTKMGGARIDLILRLSPTRGVVTFPSLANSPLIPKEKYKSTMLPLIDQSLRGHPSLTLKIVLDHAGGHNAMERRCLTRRNSDSILQAVPTKALRIPHPVQRTSSDPHKIQAYTGGETHQQLSAPTKKRNKKLHISVMNLDDEEPELIAATSTSRCLYQSAYPVARRVPQKATRKKVPHNVSGGANI
jgi:hypothetical protein